MAPCRQTAFAVATALLLANAARGGDLTAVVRQDAVPCTPVHAAPSATAKRVDCLAPGTRVTIAASSFAWRKIRTGPHEGWIAKHSVMTDGYPPANDEHWLEVHIIDVGQGDGIWIHTPDDGLDNGIYEGKNIIIDGGPDSTDERNALYRYLREHAPDEDTIDTLIVTHPHTDHYHGSRSILRHYHIRNIYDPAYPKQGSDYAKFLSEEEHSGARVMLGKQHFAPLQWGNELDATILYAYGDTDDIGSNDDTKENNASIVLRLQYGEHVFLFMADAEGKDRQANAVDPRYVENYLLSNVPAALLHATVLKIAHHGSKTSSTTPFINAVDPEIVVVSSGRKDFGSNGKHVYLPDLATLRRYCCHNPNIRIYRTDQDDEAQGRDQTNDADGDDVVIRTNGKTIIVQAYADGIPITINSCDPGCKP